MFGLTTPSSEKLKEITITQFPDAHIEFHNCSIVVCDEVLSDRRQIVTKLNELQFDKITEVSSYDKLIKSLKETKTDILFLGIGFSAIRAKEVINTIRSMNELAEIKIIAITTSISEQTENYIFLCDGYINKPIITSELLNIIKKHLVYKINKIELITEVSDEKPASELINDDLDLLPEYLLDDLISALESESEKAIKNILKEFEVYTPNLAIDLMDLLNRKKYNLIAEEINKIKLTRSNNA
jgi:CheY-like chemotaxis protein